MTTPLPINNRPGLGALRYRIGTYGDFRDSMLARLADRDPPFTPLNQLRTRSTDDPTIALLDAFAILGDILTFYQERQANEGYLRTATQPQSLQYLSKLTGYQPSAGVASSVVLAFTLDPNSTVTVPAGSRAQSVPGPGQTAQSFEISGDLPASGAWSAIQPRLTRPTQPAPNLLTVNVAGTNTGLKANDPVLQVVNGTPKLRRVASIAPDSVRQRTVVTLQPPAAPAATPSPALAAGSAPATTTAAHLIVPASPETLVTQQAAIFATKASLAPAQHPPNPQALQRSVDQLFAPNAESSLALSAGLSPAQQAAVFTSLAQTPLAPPPQLEMHAFRAHTAPFGNRAPPQVTVDGNGRVQPPQPWQLTGPTFGPPVLFSIEVTAVREGVRVFASFMREITGTLDRGGTFSDGVGFVVTVTFADTPVQLTLAPTQGAQMTQPLSAALGDVTATLNRLATKPEHVVEFIFTFSAQPLTISLLLLGTNPPTATNQRQTAAQVTLDASEETTPPVLRVLGSLCPVTGTESAEIANVLYLDGTFETITPGTWVAFDAPGDPAAPSPMQVSSVNTVSRTAYGQTARSSRLDLPGTWVDPAKDTFDRAIRQTSVYADSTKLTLVDEDVTDPVPKTPGDPTLELNGLVTGLTAGRWLVVSGERSDLPGVTAAELVMLSGASHGGETVPSGAGNMTKAGETPHTTLTFASPLAYPYKRSTVQVAGNVMLATQGETTDEILGSGNGASANQSFKLKKPNLTHVPAATPSGSANTLRIWVNNIEWRQVDTLASAASADQVFVASAATDGSCTVQFGDGVHGARLPTGTENVRARYRSGLGSSGNLDPGTITTLLSRPLGVTSVTNLAAASGGADAEAPDDARGNIPFGMASLARLVSVSDYQNYAAAFAGIGKAAARRFSGPDGPLIHLTLAGAQDNALDASSATWQALQASLRQYGDPTLEVELAARVERLVVIQAGVVVDAGQQWATVEPLVRNALLSTFGFSQRALGQSLYVSEVIATIQGVPGVSYVDLQQLTGVPQPTDPTLLQGWMKTDGVSDLIAHHARVDPASPGRPRRLLPAELIYLSDVLTDMLVLTEVPS
jgi:predicted phage baseplate assembly protein